MILLLAGLAAALDHHVVRPGETVTKIANRRDVDVVALRTLNGLAPDQEPTAGTVLRLPGVVDEGEPAATVLALWGSGTVTPTGRPAEGLTLGATLPADALVCTGPGGFATLRLATAKRTRAHDEITLLGGTCLTLDETWSDPDDHASVISVRRGSVSVRASDPGSGAVTVRTAAGVSTSDTGGFRVTVEDEGVARTEALEGDVSVLGGGKEVALAAGSGTRVKKGEAPAAPIELLEPGLPREPADGAALRRPDFRWTTVDRALGYRIEISTSPTFEDIVYAEDVGAPPWRPDTLFLPARVTELWWRIASFDRTGFVGPASPPRRVALPPGVGP